MEKKYLLISMEDERTKKLSEVLGNKTCKKIVDFLSENEASEKDISDALGIPINTAEYNLKKLVESGLVEKTKNFFWSKKGRRIDMYKLSNKSIIISPKASKVSSKVKSILPVVLASGLGALLIKIFYNQTVQDSTFFKAEERIMAGSSDVAAGVTQKASENAALFFSQPGLIWIWFLSGAVIAILIFAILNWRKL